MEFCSAMKHTLISSTVYLMIITTDNYSTTE